MGKGGKSQTVQNTYPPEILAAITGNVNYANDIASKPFAGYYDYSKGFNADNYLNQNKDVADSYQKYLGDFQTKGAAFDPSAYLKNNGDVAAEAQRWVGPGAQFETPEAYAQYHYDTYGKAEGRQGSAAGATPMSAADYAMQHWQTTGQNEGRTGGYDLKQLVAGLNGDQQQAAAMARQLANVGTPDMGYSLAGQAGQYAKDRDFGYGVAQSLGSYTPQQVTAQSLENKDLSGYMNPYTDQVINRTLGDISEQGDRAGNAVRARAAAAGSFGGSRSALMELGTAQNYADAAGDASANLRHTGYTQAQNVATADANRALQAGMANQSADLQGANLRLGAAAQMAQSGTAQNNALLGAAAGMQNAATSGQQYGINNINMLLGTGGMQQQNQQQQLDSDYEQYLRSIGYPVEMLKVRQIPLASATSTGRTTSESGGDAASTLAGVGTAAAGIAKIAGLFMASDERVKRDIRRVGATDDGLGVYTFRYIDDGPEGPVHLGLMAQEVEKVRPEAVIETPEGVKMVNYELATRAL